jgi:hypothetical protein
LICSPFASDSFPSDERPLFGFVTEVLHHQIAEQLPALVSDICTTYHDRIDGIITDQRRAESRREILEKAREARRRKLEERTGHYSCLATHMNEVPFQAAILVCISPAQTEATPPTTDPLNGDSDIPRPDFDFDFDNKVAEQYLDELSRLSQIPEGSSNTMNYNDFPVALSFAFLLCSLSPPALRLTSRFLPLPYGTIIAFSLARHEKHLQLLSSIEDQIDLFLQLSDIQEADVVSVAVDAMAMTLDHRSFMVAKPADHSFVYYAQPPFRPKKCLALHVLRDNSGKAGNKVQLALGKFCKALFERNVEVRYVCSDGDSGCNKQHYDFFMK